MSTAANRKTRTPLVDWKRFIDSALTRHEKTRFHGTVTIKIHDGRIQQVVESRSIVDPTVEVPDDRG